jgi:subfamily B ATP-binding cassette protein MsbA
MAVILPLTILGLFLMRSVATWVSDYALAKTGRSVVRDLREQVLPSTCTCRPRISIPKRRR